MDKKKADYEFVRIDYRYPVLDWLTIQANIFTHPEMFMEAEARARECLAERNAAFMKSLERICGLD